MNRAATFKSFHRKPANVNTFYLLHSILIKHMDEYHYLLHCYPRIPVNKDPDTIGEELMKMLTRWQKRKKSFFRK